MNVSFFIAGILCFILGIAHSILGELLIFHDKRNKGKLVPSRTKTVLKERHLRIIWATWHLASVFGWCIGALIIKIAFTTDNLLMEFITKSVIYTMLISSVLVLIGTKGRHPGWIVLLLIGLLLIIGY